MFGKVLHKYEEIRRESDKIRAPFLLLYYFAHRAAENVYMRIIKAFYPVDNHRIILRSFPDYSDNARALAEYLADNGYDSRYDICFDVSDLNGYKKGRPGIRFISCETRLGLYRFRWLKDIYTAKYLLFTHRPILIRSRARKEQVLVNLFHGNGYKDKSAQQQNWRAPYDFSITSGDLFVKPMAYFWGTDEDRVFPIGLPRYNWLLKRDESAKALLDSYKNNPQSKVIIWMPTYRADKKGVYRDTDSITQFPLIDTEERWKELDGICRDRNIILLVKLHPFQKEYPIPFSNFSNIKEISDEDFNRTDVPMYKLLALTDALISDYSSVAVDYLIVDRPIAFALEDFEAYHASRGFVFEDPRIYMPGHHLYSFEDFVRFLDDVSTGKDLYGAEREKIRQIAVCQSEDFCKGLLEKFGIE